jgi:hypothetical protein
MTKATLGISPYHLKQDVIIAKQFRNVSWWGFSQIHKWRWNQTHIDLGCISIYNLKRIWFWKIVAFIIKPLRIWYQWKYCKQRRNNDGYE